MAKVKYWFIEGVDKVVKGTYKMKDQNHKSNYIEEAEKGTIYLISGRNKGFDSEKEAEEYMKGESVTTTKADNQKASKKEIVEKDETLIEPSTIKECFDRGYDAIIFCDGSSNFDNRSDNVDLEKDFSFRHNPSFYYNSYGSCILFKDGTAHVESVKVSEEDLKDKDIKLNDLNYKLTRWTADFDGEKLSDKKTVCEEEHYADGVFSDENDLRSKANSSLDFNNHKMYVSVSANVTGEVLGALHSIRYCVEHKEKEAKRICIVYDCEMVNHSIEMINNNETTEKLKNATTVVEPIYFDFCKRVLVENPEIDIVTRHQESHTTGDSDFECFNSLADALCKSETYDMPINWTKENRPLKKYTDDEITNNVKRISENHSVSTDEAQKTINLRRNAVFRLAENVLQKMSWKND